MLSRLVSCRVLQHQFRRPLISDIPLRHREPLAAELFLKLLLGLLGRLLIFLCRCLDSISSFVRDPTDWHGLDHHWDRHKHDQVENHRDQPQMASPACRRLLGIESFRGQFNRCDGRQDRLSSAGSHQFSFAIGLQSRRVFVVRVYDDGAIFARVSIGFDEFKTLPAFLRELRTNAGMTQRELASRLKVTHVSVHKSEVGERRVDVAEFADWCSAFDADPVRSFERFLRN